MIVTKHDHTRSQTCLKNVTKVAKQLINFLPGHLIYECYFITLLTHICHYIFPVSIPAISLSQPFTKSVIIIIIQHIPPYHLSQANNYYL